MGIMGKRDEFWKSVWSEEGETVRWPRGRSKRGELAAKIVGATVVGAVEGVLGESLDRLAGERPAPGSANYQAENRDVQVLSTLSDEQRSAVTRLLRETAYFSIYWPMAKLRNRPDMACNSSRLAMATMTRRARRST